LAGGQAGMASKYTRLLQGESQPIPQQKLPRYVVYLDGIGQSTFEYLPDIPEFLG